MVSASEEFTKDRVVSIYHSKNGGEGEGEYGIFEVFGGAELWVFGIWTYGFLTPLGLICQPAR